MLGKTEAGREFQFLEVIGTNVLANEVVRHFSNLTAKECWESAKRVLRAKHALGGIIDFKFKNPHLLKNYFVIATPSKSSSLNPYLDLSRYNYKKNLYILM